MPGFIQKKDKAIRKLGFRNASLLADMEWVTVKAPDDIFFVTSDNPVIVTNPSCRGFYTPGLGMVYNRWLISISNKVGLIIVQSNNKILDGKMVENNKNFIKEINRAAATIADRFVYASEDSEKILRMIQNANSRLNVLRN